MAEENTNRAIMGEIPILKPKEMPKNLFQPGHAPFKPKGIGELRAFAKNMSLEMLQIVYRIACDDDERGSVRLAAADMILTRAYGRPESYAEKDETSLDKVKPSELTSTQILAMLEQVKVEVDPKDVPPVEPVEQLTEANSLQLEQVNGNSS